MIAAPRLVVDWPTLLQDLRRRGFSTGSIAQQTGLSEAVLREWRQGIKSPRHENGETLILFWCQVTAEPLERVPRTAV